MLPSRLFKFKNMGIPPPLRSLLVIHPSLSSSVAVQLRFRLRLAARPLLTSANHVSSSAATRPRRLHTSARRANASEVATNVPSSSSAAAAAEESTAAHAQEPRLQLTFTCTVPDCSERSTHGFAKRSYERGIVIVTCPKCKNKHLIADHLGWFKTTEGTGEGSLKTIEDMMRAKGQTVLRGRLDAGGVVEYSE